jgi:hypothetical protein
MSNAGGFPASSFGQFMAGPGGRLLRVVAGLALIVLGIFAIGGAAGWIVAAVGLVPIAAGVFDSCLLTGLFGGRWSGASVRACRRPAAPPR